MDARDNGDNNPFENALYCLEWVASAMDAARRHTEQRTGSGVVESVLVESILAESGLAGRGLAESGLAGSGLTEAEMHLLPMPASDSPD